MKFTIKLTEDEVKTIIANYVNRSLKIDHITTGDVTLSVGMECVGLGPMERDIPKFKEARIEMNMPD